MIRKRNGVVIAIHNKGEEISKEDLHVYSNTFIVLKNQEPHLNVAQVWG